MFSLIKENWLVNEEEQFTMVGNQHNQMTWVKNIQMALAQTDTSLSLNGPRPEPKGQGLKLGLHLQGKKLV